MYVPPGQDENDDNLFEAPDKSLPELVDVSDSEDKGGAYCCLFGNENGGGTVR